jgi:holo-[acyl-carrier protein] synthase
MMRIFQGIDLVPVSKIKEIMLRSPGFSEEIFTPDEREYCLSRPDPYIHFAGRFAAKEACLKALGTGLSAIGIDGSLKEIEVLPDKVGRPVLSISGWTAKIGNRKNIDQFTVSISHSGDFAVASVVLSGRKPECDNDKGWNA